LENIDVAAIIEEGASLSILKKRMIFNDKKAY
jgi:hypothetical protein